MRGPARPRAPPERFLHWVHTATFIPLALTGFVLFAPWLQRVAQSEAGIHLRMIHRVAAIIFGGVPIVYAILQPRRMLINLREFLSFGKYDLLRLKGAIPYYVLSRHENMPPQPRFTTGERLTAVVMMLGTITLGITGLSIWLLKGIMPTWLFQVMVFLHDLMFIVTFAMFMVHFYLAVIHPMMWQSLVSMRYGVVSESYAREHHAMWYYGEKRAKEIWEKQHGQGGHQARRWMARLVRRMGSCARDSSPSPLFGRRVRYGDRGTRPASLEPLEAKRWYSPVGL